MLGSEKYLKKLIGNTDIEDSLQKLDKLTQEGVRMATAEQLRISHSVEGKVVVVDHKLDDTACSSSPISRPFLPNAQVYHREYAPRQSSAMALAFGSIHKP